MRKLTTYVFVRMYAHRGNSSTDVWMHLEGSNFSLQPHSIRDVENGEVCGYWTSSWCEEYFIPEPNSRLQRVLKNYNDKITLPRQPKRALIKLG